MIKTHKLRDVGIRLFCLLAAVLALSQSASAWNYYMRGGANDWTDNDSYKFKTSDNKVYTLTLSSLTDGFKIHNGDDSRDNWFSTSTATTLSNGVEYTLSEGGNENNMSLPTEAKNITFTLTDNDNNGYPEKIKATWTESTTPTVKAYIIGKWPGHVENWTTGSEATVYGGGYVQFDVTPTDNGEISFQIIYDGQRYWPSGSDIIYMTNSADKWESTQTTENYKSFMISNAVKGVTYHIKFGTNNKDVNATWTESTIKPADVKMPVYPRGVYNFEQLSKYKEPTYYLCSMVLNKNRITPEYQFTKQTTGEYAGKYTLELTMRNTTTQNENWSNSDYKVWVEGFETITSSSVKYGEQSWNNISTTNDKHKEGAKYLAIFDPSTKKLTFKDLNQHMPFISMIGYDWKQREKADTPYLKTNKTYKNTDEGWQESWIQYADGKPLKDRNGKVMYNTMWPPRNPITFKTVFNVGGTDYDFALSSDQLVFAPFETKTGAEWKKDARFSRYNKAALTDTKEYENQLALDDKSTYTLYRVDNMWISGSVKLWTGWGGVTGANNDAANWSWHSNWGHYGESSSATTISAGATVPLSNKDGNMQFLEPTYFAHVDLFYNVDAPHEKGKSVLFTELAMGGAEIAAMSRENYTLGMYRPRLTDISNVKDKKLTKVLITPWSADGKKEYPSVFESTGEGKTVENFDDLFATLDGMDGNSGRRWTYDAAKYPNGNYKYVMEVVIDGVDEPIVVESNPFTIHHDNATTSLDAYQLVKRMRPEEDGLGHTDYKYVSFYDPKYNSELQTKAGKAYLVKATVDATKNDADPVFVDYKELQITETPDYGNGYLFRFSCKVLLVGGVVDGEIRDKVYGYKLTGVDASNKDLSDSYSTPENQSSRAEDTEFSTTYCSYYDSDSEDHSRYFRIVEPEINTATVDYSTVNDFKYSYKLQMSYDGRFTDSDGNLQGDAEKVSESGSVDQELVIPEPRLHDAYVQLFYGNDQTFASNDATQTFSYNGLTLDNARYQNLRMVLEIERPNITERFRKKATIYIKNASGVNLEGKYAPISNGMFGYQIMDENNNALAYSDLPKGFDPYEIDVKDNKGKVIRYEGKTHLPEVFFADAFNAGSVNGKMVTLDVKEEFRDKVVFYRRWKDGVISNITIDQKAPEVQPLVAVGSASAARQAAATDSEVPNTDTHRIVDYKLHYDNNGHLIETSRIALRFKTTSLTKDEVVALKTEVTDGESDETKLNDEINYVRRYERDGSLANAKPLLFGNAMFEAEATGQEQTYFDYYYIRVVESTGLGANDFKDIAYTDASGVHHDRLDRVVSARALRETESYEIEVPPYDFGSWWNGLDEAALADPYCKRLKVRVSYLYPFMRTEDTPASNGPRRAAADSEVDGANLTGDVIKSEAFALDLSGDDIVTSVEGVAISADSVRAGVGYIEVRGAVGDIYGTDGIRVASGEGRFDLPAGVYVVRIGGVAEKVIVR